MHGHTLGTEEGARHVQLLAAHNDNALARQELLGNNGSQTTQQVTLSVNDNNLHTVIRGWIPQVSLPSQKSSSKKNTRPGYATPGQSNRKG